MCICRINSWYGRSGNNIIQIINCLHYAFNIKNCRYIEFPSNILLKSTRIVSNKNGCLCDQIFIDKWNFFYAKYMNFKIQPFEMRALAQTYIVPILSFNVVSNSIYNNTDNTDELYIHLRGGDTIQLLYSTKIPPKKYIQPPMSFYNKIIKDNHFKKINIIHQDSVNPCVKALQNSHKNINYQSNSLVNDLKTLCSAQNLVCSFTTFILMVYFISPNIKNMYVPKYILDEWFPIEDNSWGDDIKMNIYRIDNYGNLKQWENLDMDTKKKMLLNEDYKVEKL